MIRNFSTVRLFSEAISGYAMSVGCRVTDEWWIEKDAEESDCGHTWDTVPKFAWSGLENKEQNQVSRFYGTRFEPNTSKIWSKSVLCCYCEMWVSVICVITYMLSNNLWHAAYWMPVLCPLRMFSLSFQSYASADDNPQLTERCGERKTKRITSHHRHRAGRDWGWIPSDSFRDTNCSKKIRQTE
jgi:hypothetical protein